LLSCAFPYHLGRNKSSLLSELVMKTFWSVVYLLSPLLVSIGVIVLFFALSALLSYPVSFIGNLDQ
jgi:hypothetical protein